MAIPLHSNGNTGIQASKTSSGYAQAVMLAWRSVIFSETKILKLIGRAKLAVKKTANRL